MLKTNTRRSDGGDCRPKAGKSTLQIVDGLADTPTGIKIDGGDRSKPVEVTEGWGH